MTLHFMSDKELSRVEILRDLTAGRPTDGVGGQRVDGPGAPPVLRLSKAYQEQGATALISKKRGRPSNWRTPTSLKVQVLEIIDAASWVPRTLGVSTEAFYTSGPTDSSGSSWGGRGGRRCSGVQGVLLCGGRIPGAVRRLRSSGKAHAFSRTPAPPPVSALIKTTPASSRTCCTRSIVPLCIPPLPFSKRVIVEGATPAALARSRRPGPST